MPASLSDLTGLKRRAEFLFVRGGRTERRKSLLIQARRRKGSSRIGVGFTATKKIGNAVIRNRCKRRLREAARQLLLRHGTCGVDYVFIARKDTPSIPWRRLLDDMESALISLGPNFGPDPSNPE